MLMSLPLAVLCLTAFLASACATDGSFVNPFSSKEEGAPFAGYFYS